MGTGGDEDVAAGYAGELYTNGMRPVCFLSDFGLTDDFAGTCKGVMLRIAPGVSIVDLTHEVPGFGVETGAEILRHATRYMPADTIYLAVVDPGVGTERRGSLYGRRAVPCWSVLTTGCSFRQLSL